MKDNFEKAWQFTVVAEGNYSNDPNDIGGETKWGYARNMHPEITDAQWAIWTEQDSKNGGKKDYWDACNCDNLSTPLDILVFDAAYNMGPKEALFILQEVKLRPGDDTWEYLLIRIRHYSNKVQKDPTKIKNFRGWVNRVLNLFDEIVDPSK